MKLQHVTQRLTSSPLADIPSAVAESLDRLASRVPQGPVAITGGSRGICNLEAITRAAGEWLRSQGAEPFLVPCMGSHNGATAEGQRTMLESLGLTEQAIDMPIRATMQTVKVGQLATGPIVIGRHCDQAAGILVINRIKLHTAFSGPPESGLMKMMAVGMGKIDGARTFHAIPTADKATALIEMAQAILATDKVIGGLGILEDGYDQTAELHALAPEEIVAREPELLEHYRQHYFPRLPVDELDVLVIDQIGKTYSGVGLDPNVVGRRGLAGVPDFATPKIKTIAALELSKDSQGNALGFGLCDTITQRLHDAIDFEKTRINAETSGELARIAPCHIAADDRAVFDWCRQRSGDSRWMVIPNTLHLDSIWASKLLCDELRAHPRCEADGVAQEPRFVAGRHQLAF